jgi:large subunit ribosomal protein L2
MLKSFNPTSPGRRQRKILKPETSGNKTPKSLTKGFKRSAGRNKGRVSVRHRQNGPKRLFREIDFKRLKDGIVAKVISIDYDPNRGANIALLQYADGSKSYILAPESLPVGSEVISGERVEPTVGNCMTLENIPPGMEIHNVELNPKAGGVLARGAGNYTVITAKEGDFVNVRLPSGEVKQVSKKCRATIGILSNSERKNVVLGKAGVTRYKGRRPAVRGVAMADPKHDHPHAGSYSTSGIGMSSPKTPWGKKARGVKTRKRNRTDYTIVTSRHSAKRGK